MDVAIPKRCRYDLQASVEASLPQPVPEDLLVVSGVDLVEAHEEEVSVEAFEEVSDKISEVVEEALDTKAEVVLVAEVGMVVVLLTATATVQHHPPMPLLARAEGVASVVDMAARLSTVV